MELLCCLAGLVALVTPTSLAATAPPNPSGDVVSWSLGPTVRASQPGRAFFDYTIGTGQTVEDSATLTNSSARPLTFQIYTADAVNSPTGGGFAILGPSEPHKDVSAWTALPAVPPGGLTVAPGMQAIIPFAVTVPQSATPGDHAGGVVALRLAEPGEATGPQLNLRRGIGARVFVRVPGKLRSGLAITSVRVRKSVGPLGSGHATITYQVRNTGNVRLDTSIRLKATGLFGETAKTFPVASIPVLLPGSAVTLSQPWHLPQLGRFHLKIVASASGQPAPAAAKGGATVWVVPWLIVLIIVLVATVLVVWLRRRRHQHAAKPIEPEQPLSSAAGS